MYSHSKMTALAIAAALTGTLAATPIANSGAAQTKASAAPAYDYASALQMSFFFYEAQQAGPIADWNRVSWRADSTLNDSIQGGWYDAGDHLKLTMPAAYSCTMLAWGLYEYKDAVEKVGELQNYVNNLGWGLDYLVKCDLGSEVVFQIGDFGADHKWWGPAEMYDYKVTTRPTLTCKGSAVSGEMAAALAAGSVALKGLSDRTDDYLKHAKNCYKIAATSLSDDGYDCEAYQSSHFYDELFWAANWLYIATGDDAYLADAKSYIPHLGLESQSTELKYTWGHCWDDVQQGGTLLYAMNTGDAEFKKQISKHLDYWTVGYGGKKVDYTADGLAWLTNWGALRHTTATSFLAEVAVKNLFSDDATLSKRYSDFAESQLNYCLGNNAAERSYVIGYGENYPQHYHHRTANGAWNDLWQEGGKDKPHRHVLYGALVGGPGKDGGYKDVISSYENSEVATDYNAAYTGLLCAMVDKYGGKTDPNFPVAEVADGDEFYMEAAINQNSDCYTEIKAQATNHSAFPARVVKDLSYRYFFDISEMLEAGYTADDISVRIGYDEYSDTQLSKPVQYDGSVYYVEISYPDGTVVRPTGQSEHQAELQFRISAPEGTKVWDPSNDYSYEGLQSGNNNCAKTSRITMYDAGRLIYGVEPDGTTPEDVNPITTTATTNKPDTKLLGDVDCNKTVNVLDFALYCQYLVRKESLTNQGALNADMNADKNLSVVDAVLLARKIAE